MDIYEVTFTSMLDGETHSVCVKGWDRQDALANFKAHWRRTVVEDVELVQPAEVELFA